MTPKTRSLFYTIFICFLTAGSAFAQTADIIDTVSPDNAAPGDSEVSVDIYLDSTLDMPPVPPTDVSIKSVSIGSIDAKSFTRPSEYRVTATFDFPTSASTGIFDLVLMFNGPQGDLIFTEAGAFTIGAAGSLQVTISPSDAVNAGAKWSVDGGALQDSGAVVDGLVEGAHVVRFTQILGWGKPDEQTVAVFGNQTATSSGIYTQTAASSPTYPVVDTGQDFCSDDSSRIPCPSTGESFFGQDAQHNGYPFMYTNNGDGTVTDNITGLMWQQTTDTDGDGDIDVDDKKTQSDAKIYCENLILAGYTDWRLPTIKESYSLIDFRGTDPSGLEGDDTSGLVPFIDDTVFEFNFGDTAAGERIIDSQYASDTLYVDTSANNGSTMFGVNFADGRIKGYATNIGPTEKTFYCMCVRGNTSYGVNGFMDNGDGTITDTATGLMWDQDDNGSGVNWENALAWVDAQNAANHLGHSDWRLPNAKELQSIVDYGRSPGTSGSAAIDPLFNATSIINEAGQTDYPYYWSSTTHLKYNGSVSTAAYLSFGRAMGDYGRGDGWEDVHGAGAQRSDPKAPETGVTYPNSSGPQGDAQRVYNYVRLVRDADDVQYTLSDAVAILQVLAGGDLQTDIPDPSGNGKVGLEDVILIIGTVAGLR